MASHWVIYTSLVLFSVGLAYGGVRGGQDCACPTVEPNLFSTGETDIRDELASIGPMRLMYRNGIEEEKKYTCLTLEFTSNNAYTIRWMTETDNGTFSGWVPHVWKPKSAGDRDHWRVGLSKVQEEVFNMQGGNAWLQFTLNNQIVIARSCKAVMDMGWTEGHYVFLPEAQYMGPDEIEEEKDAVEQYMGIPFEMIDFCPDSF